MKHLRDIIEAVNKDSFKPQAKDEREVTDTNKIEKIADRNGNGDDVFNATNIKTFQRKSNRFGQEPSVEDGNKHKKNPLQKNVKMVATEEVSEELNKAQCLKPVDKKINDRAKTDLASYILSKRYGKPTEKKIAKEEVEQVEELSHKVLRSYIKKSKKEQKDIVDKHDNNAFSINANPDDRRKLDNRTTGEWVAKRKSNPNPHARDAVTRNGHEIRPAIKVPASKKSVKEEISSERLKLAIMNKGEKKEFKKWDGEKALNTRTVEKEKPKAASLSASDIVKKFRSKVAEEKIEEIGDETLRSYSRKATKELDSGELDSRKEKNRDNGIGLATDKRNDAKRIISKPKTKVPASEAFLDIVNTKPLLLEPVAEKVSPNPSDREVGTDSLVNNFKSVTPGEAGSTETVIEPVVTQKPKKKSISELTEGLKGGF